MLKLRNFIVVENYILIENFMPVTCLKKSWVGGIKRIQTEFCCDVTGGGISAHGLMVKH